MNKCGEQRGPSVIKAWRGASVGRALRRGAGCPPCAADRFDPAVGVGIANRSDLASPHPISFRNSAFLNIVTALSDAMTAQESIKSGDDADAVRWIDNAMTQLKAARKMLVRIK